MITKEQIKTIKTKTGKSGLNLPTDVYKEMLLNSYNVDSCTKLTESQANEFIRQLSKLEKEAGIFKNKKENSFLKNKYHHLDGREGMATSAQARMIESMWFRISRQTTDKDRAAALRKFMKRIAGVEAFDFLTHKGASKLINALGNMKK